LVLNPGRATLNIEKPVIPIWAGNAYATSEHCEPVRSQGSLEGVGDFGNEDNIAVVVARDTIHKPFNTENNILVDLVVVPKLATSDEGAVACCAEMGPGEAIGDVSLGPTASEVSPNIEAGPHIRDTRER
jgi:hypothetical protein